MQAALSAAAIAVAAALVYAPILGGAGTPWGSDTLGHVMKAVYLTRQLGAGNLYPDLFPGWYLGLQMLRYYPPVPYYLLVAAAGITGDPLTAPNLLIAAAAAAGGWGWLCYRRWLGGWLALAGGLLHLILPDHVRVAMAEGNIPRVVATALLPWVLFAALRSLDEGAGMWPRAGLALGVALLVLCHAMMAAIVCTCLALVAMAAPMLRAAQPRPALTVVVSSALGLALSGWWLLPSLTGGITEIDAAAMTEALAVISPQTYLNPLLRLRDPETIAVGSALLLTATLLLFLRGGRAPLPTALTLAGLFGVAITMPVGNGLFQALPLHQLLWPLRFLGAASTLLLLAVLMRLRTFTTAGPVATAAVAGLVLFIAADSAISLRLIHLRPPRPDMAPISAALARTPGWREATIDLSRLGSAPSYHFTADGGREQVFGWAYQGARTAATVASLNEAVERGDLAYLCDRLDLYGVDDIVLLDTLPSAPEVGAALERSGFRRTLAGREASLYHRDGAPRAIVAAWPALGIGRYAPSLAALFPQVVVGTATAIDDYDLETLTRYRTVVVSGATWHDRGAAERLVARAAAAGVRVVVDMAGMPDDPWAREPQFLGVWGERITLGTERVTLVGDGEPVQLRQFSDGPTWSTLVPQGLDTVERSFAYNGVSAAAIGEKRADGGGVVRFIGLHLAEHVRQHDDPAALALLAGALGLPPRTMTGYRSVALEGYRAGPEGTTFAIDAPSEMTVLLPVAAFDGTRLAIDGRPARLRSLERLVVFDAPAGRHTVTITAQPPPVALAGQAVSVAAALALAAWWRRDRRRIAALKGAPA